MLKKPPSNALQVSELRYRRLFESAREGIVILDSNSGKIIDANPFLEEMLGFPQPEILGKNLWEIGIFKDKVKSKAAFNRLKSESYIRYQDLAVQTKNGGVIAVELVSNSYMVGKQKVIQCNIRSLGLTLKAQKGVESRAIELERLNKTQEDTKKAMLNVMEDLEEAKDLIELEKVKDEAMLASLGEGLIAVDNHGRVIVMNKVAEDILGWKIKEMIGKEVTNLPLEDEQGNLLPLDQRPTTIALKTGKTVKVSHFFVRKDKTRTPIAITATPIKLDGKTLGLIEIIRDVTQEREIDRAKSEFVSLASHQLRTPLGIMKWSLEALENEQSFKESPKLIHKYFDEIYKNNERVLSLVRDLLSVSRIDQRQIKNNPETVDLPTVVAEVVNQMQLIAQRKDVTLSLTSKDVKPLAVEIDRLRFHQVMENLIGNAIEYTPPKGKVKVVLKVLKSKIAISITDTGIGISEADQQRLFTKFFRAERAVGFNPEGSGLGLYVVKSYVDGWGGEVTVDSSEGNGSTFTIILPI
jgi:PAS domain S-box-containing protein